MLPDLPYHISTLAQILLQPCDIATFILYVNWPSVILCGHMATYTQTHILVFRLSSIYCIIKLPPLIEKKQNK